MKKNLTWIISGAVLVIISIILIIVLSTGTNDKKDSKLTSDTIEACSLFTEAEAKSTLGSAAQKGTESGPNSTKDIQASICSYNNGSTDPATFKTAAVIVRSPLSQKGANSNAAQFNKLQSSAKEVSGYGEKAYWSPVFGQLNILKDNNWITVYYGSLSPQGRTLGDAEKVAKQALGQ